MNTYNIPEEPAGPVWDKEGRMWVRADELWLSEGRTWKSSEWHQLLYRNGPVTDMPPAKKVGDKVTLNEFSKMPHRSIAGAYRDVYINYMDRVFTDAQACSVDLSDYGDDVVTVLRVGGGEE